MISHIPSQAATDAKLTATALRVLVLLAAQAVNGWATPTQDRLAQDLHVSRSTICRAVDALRQRSYVEIQHSVRLGATYARTAYRVRLDNFQSDGEGVNTEWATKSRRKSGGTAK